MGKRTLFLVGDSLAKQQYESLSSALAETHQNTTDMKLMDGLALCTQVYAFRLCFVECARSGGMQRVAVPTAAQVANRTDAASSEGIFNWRCRQLKGQGFWYLNLGDTLSCMQSLGLIESPSDILVINAGVHHNHPNVTLKTNVEAMLQWHQRLDKKTRPCVLWRETTPQHFDSVDGTYALANIHGTSDSESCHALRTVEGKQKFNAFSNKILEGSSIPIIRVWDTFAPMHEMHLGLRTVMKACNPNSVGGVDGPLSACVSMWPGRVLEAGKVLLNDTLLDCTHWNPVTVALSVQMLLVRVEEECLSKNPPQW
jgi:hypothetical protein